MMLKGQDFLDQTFPCTTLLTVDLTDLPWNKKVPKGVEWSRVHAIVFLNPRESDIETIKHELHQLAFSVSFTAPQYIILSKTVFDCSRAAEHLFCFEQHTLLVTTFKQPPNWTDVRTTVVSVHGPLVLIGTLGIDRVTFPIAHKLLGLNGHAFCIPDANSERWVALEPAMSLGRYTRTKPQPEWHHCMYVSDKIGYADCRTVSNSETGAWLLCRWSLRRDEPRMFIEHPLFRDYMPHMMETPLFITHLRRLWKSPAIIDTLKYIRKRNQDGPNEPQWCDKFSARCNTVEWNTIWNLQLAERTGNIVRILFNGRHLLHMLKDSQRI